VKEKTMGDIDLHSLAVNALTKVDRGGDRSTTTRLAVKVMHDVIGGPLRPLVDAVHRAIDGPRVALTRAVKERAVAEMAQLVSAFAENYVYASYKAPGAGDPKVWQRRERWARAALVRLAMARTVD
jgi:hypothetical protein